MTGIPVTLAASAGEPSWFLQLSEASRDMFVFLIAGILFFLALWWQFAEARVRYGNDDWTGPPINCEACGAPNEKATDECNYCGVQLRNPDDT